MKEHFWLSLFANSVYSLESGRFHIPLGSVSLPLLLQLRKKKAASMDPEDKSTQVSAVDLPT